MIKLPEKFDTLSPRQSPLHLYGHSLFLWDNDTSTAYIFVNIPKNASSFVKGIFRHAYQFNYLTNKFLDELPDDAPATMTMLTGHREYLVVLRHPVERWVTGLAQCVNPQRDYSESELVGFIQEPIMLNSHLEPQISFLDQLETKYVTWFDVNNRLFKNIFTYALNKGMRHILFVPNVHTDNTNSFNFTSKKPKVWRNFVNDLAFLLQDNPEYYQKIEQAYQEDMDLYNTVKFFDYREHDLIHGPR